MEERNDDFQAKFRTELMAAMHSSTVRFEKLDNHRFKDPVPRMSVLFLTYENFFYQIIAHLIQYYIKNGRWKILVPAFYHYITAFHLIVSHVHILHFFFVIIVVAASLRPTPLFVAYGQNCDENCVSTSTLTV